MISSSERIAGTPAVAVVAIDDRGRPVAQALREVADSLASGDGPCAVIASTLKLPAAAVADLTAPRPGPSAAATARMGSGCAIRVLHHRVVDVATSEHVVAHPTSVAVGFVRIAAADRTEAARLIGAAAEKVPTRPGEPDPATPEAFNWLLLALVRGGVVVKADPIDPWPWSTTGDVGEIDEPQAHRVRLQRANRADDGIYSMAVLRRLSKPLSGFAANRGWSPNTITVVSLFVGLAAAACFATGARGFLILGALLLQASLIIDCSDGEVARLTGRYSTVGAWLDAATDRVKEYTAYAGLAAGAAANGMDVWWLAAATMVLQTGRHLADYTFHQVQVRRETAGVVRPLDDTSAQTDRYTGIIAVATRANERPWLRSMKKVIFLPIGERWLIISLTAALLTPWWTFVLLIAGGLVALAYASAGRVLRTRTWPRLAVGEQFVAPQVDATALSQLLGRRLPLGAAMIALPLGFGSWTLALTANDATVVVVALVTAAVLVPAGSLRLAGARFAWALPSLLAVWELTMWLVGAARTGGLAPAWGFALAGVVAFHRYDLLYRALAGRPAPAWVVAMSGGTDGRILVMAVLTATGALATGIPVLAVVLTVTGVLVASAQWLLETKAA